MANNASHYRDLAAQAHIEADKAILDNVRDRALRSAAAFESMAEQLETTTAQRLKREAATATHAAAKMVA